MTANRLLGLCLIILGVINVLHEVVLRVERVRQPGLTYAVVTALFFTAGASLLWRGKLTQKN
ncbi:MAG TPA: hypothetical protein VE135_14125 [Pyrinomonadaceae bacterium]|nr:hypothetical protein [Pyrinomonadaceae bacterium]